jgi:hypothetical protein
MTMDFLRVAFRRVKALFSGEILDRDMDKEMRVHLDLLVEEYERAGMSPEEARRAASRRFGNLLRIKERGRDIRGAGILEDILRDALYAVRNLRRTPAFTSTVVLTLAIGIGANTSRPHKPSQEILHKFFLSFRSQNSSSCLSARSMLITWK